MRFLFLTLLVFITATSFSQTKTYNGSWTKILSTYQFDFDLVLEVNESNQVEGYFVWELVEYDKYNTLSIEYYENKVGMTGTEYVKGTYDPTTQEYKLEGYKKDDPNVIIGLDVYQLKVDDEGNIGGTTSANGTWFGRINGQPKPLDPL